MIKDQPRAAALRLQFESSDGVNTLRPFSETSCLDDPLVRNQLDIPANYLPAKKVEHATHLDTDLQYALHQPDYFLDFEFAGVSDFEGRRCYWLHGTTHWGKDDNQFYDVETGLLAGYRFQSDNSSSVADTTVTYEPLSDSLFELPPALKTN